MNEPDRVRWARTLTTAGWLITFAFLLYLVGQIRRAMATRRASFEDGLWGQRIEIISFAALPQNLIVLVPAALAGAGAIWLHGGPGLTPLPWARQLVRTVAGIAYVMITFAALGILDLFAQTPDQVGGSASLLNLIGGMLVAAAVIRVCLESERASRP